MRRRIARFAKTLAAILLALCLGGLSGAIAQEIYTVQVSGAYGQTEARRMLDLINEFRTGGEAWYWNADNASRTLCGDLQPLVYDSGLEKVAMQRAAEIALSFSHTRPDRSDCFTAYSLSGATYWAQAENIAAGHPGAEATFVQWKEDGENYGGQGHRRNMLSASFNAVGIGHINFNGTHYWVQEFGYAPTPSAAQTSPNDAAARVDVQIAASAIASAQLSFEPASLALSPGESADLPACTARISVLGAWPGGQVPVGVDCAWASDSDAVASLDGEGRVTAGQAGNANLTAMALGRTGAVPVRVAGEAVRPTGITLEPPEPQTLYIGSELQLRAILEPAGAKCEVEWSATYEGEAPLSVSDDGLVTPLRPGRATVTASANLPSGDALSASVNIAVLDPGEPSGIRIEPAGPVRLNLGEALRMSAALQPAGAKAEIAWHIDGAGIASIDENSMLTGLREGAATCYASVTVHRPEPVELKSNEIEIRVIDPTRPTSIALNQSGTVELSLGDTLQLHATLEPETAVSELEWSSSNAQVAQVDGEGNVTPLAPGPARITVKAAKRSPAGEELSAGVNIHVTDPHPIDPTRPTSIALDKSGTVELNLGDALRLNAKLEPETAVSELEWSSTNAQVAQVDGEGNVTPLEPGTAVITVKAVKRSPEGEELSAGVNVNVVDPHPIDPTRPTSIALDQSGTVELNLGDALRLNAKLEPETAVSELEWSSSNGGAAIVSGDGLVTAVGEGSAVITVKAAKRSPEGEDLSASVNVHVTDPHPIDPTRPTSIALDKSGTLELNLGDTLQLHATLEPETAVSELEWSSSNGGAAIVSGDGLVTAVGEGSAVITVKAAKRSLEGEELSAGVNVNVVDPHPIDPTRPTSIALDKSGTVELNLGDALQLHATLEPETAVSELEWSSSNGGAAIVSGDGLVTAVGEGSAVITVKAAKRSPEGEELSAGVTIHVTDPNRPNPDDPDPDDPDPDEPGPDNPESDDPEPDDPDPDEPDPDDPNPDDPGPDDPGPDDPDKPATLTLEPSGAVEMDIRETLQLRAIWEPAGAERALDWSSSKASVARVDGNGKVTPAGAGEAIITAVAEDGGEAPLSASVTVRVVKPEGASSDKPKKLTLDRSGTVKLDIDKTLRLNATLAPATAWSELKWSSSNRKVARVDANGRVTPGAEGRAKITVTAVRKGAKGKKLSASVKIQVVDPYKPSGIRLDQGGTVLLDIDEALQLRATLEPEGIARGELKWSSSNNKVARVDDSGLVTPIKEGKAKITAQSVKKGAKGKKLSASVKIQVVDPYKPAGVSIDQSGPLWLNIGDALTLTATMRPDDARSNLTWSSSNKKIAKVEYDAEAGGCVVTGKRAGSAKITVKTRNGKKNTVSLKIVDPTKATGVSLNFSGTVELSKGETLELVATMQPATATSKLRWSSSNRKIATVKPASAEDIAAGRAKLGSCVVTAKRSGTVKISVRTSTGKKASVKLKITAAKDLPERAEEPLEPVEEPPMEIQIEAVTDVPEAKELPEADVAAGNSSCEVAAECFPERAEEPSPEK